MEISARERIIYAMDPLWAERHDGILEQLAPYAGQFMIQTSSTHSSSAWEMFRAIGTRTDRGIFYDARLACSPQEAFAAVASLPATVWFVTLGPFAGPKVQEAALNGASKMRGMVGANVCVLAATLPPECTHDDLVALGIFAESDGSRSRKIEELLRLSMRLALLAQQQGLDGALVAPRDITAVREVCQPGFRIVAQGIRLPSLPLGDTPTITPREAIAAGADLIIVEWPFQQDPSPFAAGAFERVMDLSAASKAFTNVAREVLQDVEQGLNERPVSFLSTTH